MIYNIMEYGFIKIFLILRNINFIFDFFFIIRIIK